MSSPLKEMHKVSSFVIKKLLSGDAECSLRIQPFHLATRNVPRGVVCYTAVFSVVTQAA